MKILLYRFLKRFFLTRHFVIRMENRFKILYPSTPVSIRNKCINTIIRVLITSILLCAILICVGEISLYYIVITVAVVYSVMVSSLYSVYDKLELKLLEQLEQFITDVRFRFQFDGMIEEAIQEAISYAPYEMSIHGEKIYEYLKNLRDGFGMKEYKDICPNELFLTFYAMCETIIMYGDKKTEGSSIFLKNLGYLKEEINIEVLRRKEIKDTFAGLLGVSILPIFAIKPIEIWTESNLTEFAGGINNSFNIITTIVLAFVAVTVYMLILVLRYPYRSYSNPKENSILNIFKNIKCFDRFVMYRLSRRYAITMKISLKLKEVVYPYNIKEFYIRRIYISVFTGLLVLIIGVSINIECGGGIICFSAVTASLISFILTYTLFYIQIGLRKSILLLDREQEVVRFQTMVLMMMHMDRIGVAEIIEWLEEFALVFKMRLESISDKLPYMGISVFEENKEEIEFLPFRRLLDGFMACDIMPINKAFEEIEADRRYYVEKHRQENSELIRNKGAVCRTIAFIPMCSIIIIKLIIPFIMEGMKELSSFNFN